VEHLPPVTVKDEPYVVHEGYVSHCCRFMTLMLFMPPLSGVERDMNMEIEFDFCEGTPYNAPHYTSTTVQVLIIYLITTDDSAG